MDAKRRVEPSGDVSLRVPVAWMVLEASLRPSIPFLPFPPRLSTRHIHATIHPNMSEGPIPAQNGQPSAVAQSPLNSAKPIEWYCTKGRSLF
jgi:hypothetical protein